MIAIMQDDVPYIVLTEDPYLQAYRTDGLGDVEPLCPAETGTAFCQQVSYEPLLAPRAGVREQRGRRRPRACPAAWRRSVPPVIAIAAFLLGRARGRREIEPLELEA